MHTRTSFRGFSPAKPAGLALIAVVITILLAVAVASTSGVAAQGATPIVAGTPAPTVNACDTLAPGTGAEGWIRTELYFGTTLPDGSELTAEQWGAFLDAEITPRFPDGLTVLEGYGQFLTSEDVIVGETSIVLIIVHPAVVGDESSAAIEEIRERYEEEFDQESVLRVDAEPVCVSF